MTVKAGFDGKFKDGGWIPVRVVLENNGADLQGLIKINFSGGSNDTNTYEYPIELPSVSRKEIAVYVFSQGYLRTLNVSLTSGKKILNQVQLQLDNFGASELWFGVLASNPTTFNVLAQLKTINSTPRTIPLELSDIPERAHVLNSLDVIIFSGIDTGKLTSIQRQTLIEWVAGGGRLVLIGGSDWQKTTAGFLETEMLPFLPVDSKVVMNLQDLQRFAHSSEPFSDLESGIIVTTGGLTEGAQVLAKAENSTPLVLSKRYGAGEVLYLTFDPGLPPVKSWDGREALFQSLFSNPLDKPSWLLGMRNWSQAKEAALTLPNLNLPSPLLICGFLVLYILTLGPLNYLLVRVLKRSEWGWVTIPVMVLCFSGLIILIGSLSRGNRVILNRLAVIQVWSGVPLAKVDGVMGVYSPTRSAYQAEVNAPNLLYPFPADVGGTANSYSILETGTRTTISGLKLEISGVEPLAFGGSTPAPNFTHNLEITLSSTSALLQGSVTNTSDLFLTNAVLLYPGGYVQIGDLPPGKSFDVHEQLSRSQLAGEPNLNPTFPYATSYYGFPAPYSTPTDTTVSDILGTSSYYDDRKIYRKYSFLSAVTNNNFGTGSSRGSGIYLVGWSDHLPIEVNVPGTNFNTQDNIFYVIAFRPTLQTGQKSSSGEAFTLTPGTFNWSILEGYDPAISPYGVNVYPGMAFSMQFTPILPVEFSEVKSLVLHLDGQAHGTSVTGIILSIWNYDLDTWEKLDDLRWGDNTLDNPDRYVGTDGSLRLNLISGQVSGLQITQLDFSLELEK